MNPVRRAAQRALRAWSARRHGRDALPLVVDRRRIYILPSARGLALAVLVAAMTIAGLNYASSLGLAFAFLTGAIGLVGMHHCHRNLLGLSIDAATETDGFAGLPCMLRFTLANDSALDRHDVEIRCGGATAIQSIPAGAVRNVEAPLTTPERGVVRFAHFELRTGFPFGWFRAWTYVQAPLVVHVAPRPDGVRRLPAPRAGAAALGARRPQPDAEGDFAGLHAYVPGMPLKHMAWKSLARGGEAAVRRYEAAAAEPLWLDWDHLRGLAPEPRLAQLCLWVLESDRVGRAYGLRVPGTIITAASGPLHRQHALRALAAVAAPRT